MSERKPFELEVEGKAVIPHMAERAKINIHIANSGDNKATVSREVLSTARELEGLLKELSPKEDTQEAREAAPLAYWSKTSLSATSHVRHDKNGQPLPDRTYNGSINFDIRFRDFKALGGFCTTVSRLSHVEVQNINWILTTTTEDHFRSQLRKKAAKDAMDKARDYCEVLGCTNIRPIGLREGSGSIFAATSTFAQQPSSLFGANRQMNMQASSPSQQMMMPAQQQLLLQRQQQQQRQQSMFGSAFAGPEAEPEIEDGLEFTPQEIRMDWNVWVKFQADPSANQ